MNTTPETEPTPTPPAKARKTRKAKPERSRKPIDPAIAQIRAEAKERVRAYRLAQKSGAVLARIESDCEKLTLDDKAKLAVSLQEFVSASAS